MIARARRVVVVADSTKIGRAMLARIVGLESVDQLVTDEAADPVELQTLRAAGVEVIVAPTVRTTHASHRQPGDGPARRGGRAGPDSGVSSASAAHVDGARGDVEVTPVDGDR
jgi:hypothetical protein